MNEPSRAPFVRLIAAIAVLLPAPPAAFAAVEMREVRTGDRPVDLVRKTNRLYGNDCFWAGPRGMEYAMLPADEVRAVQVPNLYPDVQATYFVARFKLPEGARLSFAGRYPHARYLSYALQTRTGDEYLAGDVLTDIDIAPVKGSRNPFLPGARRDGRARDYVVHVASGQPPSNRAANTIYTGSSDPGAEVALVIRHYVPDRGRDGTGDAGLPTLRLRLADGRNLSGEEACRALGADTTSQAPAGFPAQLWTKLIGESPDPAHAPATDPVKWDRFWNVRYNLLGKFLPQAEREARFPPTDDGGFASNPDTRYLSTNASRAFGPLLVISGRLPATPRTLAGAKRMPRHDLRYWSLCTGAAPPSGAAYDCVFDEQVALRDGRYTIVASRPEDRPANARPECGVTWLDFGDGEAIPGPTGPGRPDMAVLYMRFMKPNPAWSAAPQNIKRPGEEQDVMADYFPVSAYVEKEEFEKRAC